MDKISYLIILRALFLFNLIEKGWSIKRISKQTFEITKSIKQNI